ncbi:hypothetical protein PPERSA_12701 [Pseudocohnilembus persalinus]|uniref:Uncharacterized protein n=1 Tax=Pseudocohnilembus persalinus TaxID=266149 RepID=A0A0V0QT30_PSEPJ|nr:hypothetical protein PPERSA_12701 [Pseudocohnilembus persalinus]|eukprot:KRX05523.1 hypothetical protein PPERSA_12701 [Pseudocohnilembus persalinus]
METLVQRWKAQKSASKQNSMDDMLITHDGNLKPNNIQNQYIDSPLKISKISKRDYKNTNFSFDENTNVNSSNKKKDFQEQNFNQTQNSTRTNQQQQHLNTSKKSLSLKHSNKSKSVKNIDQKFVSTGNNLKSSDSYKKLQTQNSNSNLNKKIDIQSIQREKQNNQQSISNNSGLFPPKPLKKTVNYILDESLYKLMDIFKHSEQNLTLTYQEKVSKVRQILEQTVQTTQFMSNPRIQQLEEIEKQYNKIKNQQTQNLQDAHTKIIQELENKLFNTERVKIQLKNENEALITKLQTLERQFDDQQITTEIWQEYKKSMDIIKIQNQKLQQDLDFQKQINNEQQILFNDQLNEVQEIINKLKSQILEQTNYQGSDNKSLSYHEKLQLQLEKQLEQQQFQHQQLSQYNNNKQNNSNINNISNTDYFSSPNSNVLLNKNSTSKKEYYNYNNNIQDQFGQKSQKIKK